MSTLTKILIVLLTISSVFLCGLVVTYVANADNYRQKYERQRASLQASKENEESAKALLIQKRDEYQRLEDELKHKIAALDVKIDTLEGQLADAEREKAILLKRVDDWVGVVRAFSETADQKEQLLTDTLEKLHKVEAEQFKQSKELEETTSDLLKKMAIIETLQADKRRLLEQKTDLQNKLDKLLMPTGEEVIAPVPVTPEPEKVVARPIPPTKEIQLKGLVTKVDLKNSIASISIGAADGVREGMKFHVTRGEEFICDIIILDVDAEEAVGFLELVQQQPRAGDNVSTNL